MSKTEARVWGVLIVCALGALLWLQIDTRGEMDKIRDEANLIGYEVEAMAVRCR